MIRRARKLYAHESLSVELDQTVYALDSTTIDLCLSLFPWARFRSAERGRAVGRFEGRRGDWARMRQRGATGPAGAVAVGRGGGVRL